MNKAHTGRSIRSIFVVSVVGVLSGCAALNPAFEDPAKQQTLAGEYYTGTSDLEKAIDYAEKTQVLLMDWRGQLAGWNSTFVPWSLFGLAVGGATGAAYNASKDLIVGIGLGAATIAGADQLTVSNTRIKIFHNGHRTIQCAIQAALEMERTNNDLVGTSTGAPVSSSRNFALRAAGRMPTDGVINRVRSILNKQRTSLSVRESETRGMSTRAFKRPTSNNINRLIGNERLVQAKRDSTVALNRAVNALEDTHRETSDPAIDLAKTVTAVRYAVLDLSQAANPDSSTIFDQFRNQIGGKLKALAKEIEDSQKEVTEAADKMDKASSVAGDPPNEAAKQNGEVANDLQIFQKALQEAANCSITGGAG